MDGAQTEALQQVWRSVEAVRSVVAELATQHANDAVRLNSAKLLEQLALLLSGDTVPAVPRIIDQPAALPPGNKVPGWGAEPAHKAAHHMPGGQPLLHNLR